MKKIIYIVIILCSLQCIGKNKQEATTLSNTLIEDSTAILKNNKAVDIYLKSRGNTDSLRKAINLLDEALSKDPNYGIAYANKVQYLSILGHNEEAMAVIDQALSSLPDDPQLNFIKGVFYEKENLKEPAKKSFEKAVLCYDNLISSNPEDFNLLTNRAFVQLFTENSQCAIASLKALKNKYNIDEEKCRNLDRLIAYISEINRNEYIKNFWTE